MKPKLTEEVAQDRDVLFHYYMKHYRRAMRTDDNAIHYPKKSLFFLFRERLTDDFQLRDFYINGALCGIGTVKNKHWKPAADDPEGVRRQEERARQLMDLRRRIRTTVPPF